MRDPRTDPQVGDFLKRGQSRLQIEVIERKSGGVWIKYHHWSVGKNEMTRWRSLQWWQKWAATATIIHRAEDWGPEGRKPTPKQETNDAG